VADWDGRAYRQVNTLQQWLAERALAGWDGLALEDARKVLDVGCGDGRITAEIAARLPRAQVVGIDPSPRMIEIAPASDRVAFRLDDVLGMSFEDEFDAVVSFNALHWVSQQQAALRRIAAALREGGAALLVLVCDGPRRSLEDTAMDVTARPEWREYFRGYSAPFVHPDPASYPDLVEASGMRVVDLQVDDLSWDFGSAEAFRRWCRVGFGAWTDRLPDDAAADAFTAAVADAYADVTGSTQVFQFMQMRARLART
jgi:trans-aconitate 2-methyltransferase